MKAQAIRRQGVERIIRSARAGAAEEAIGRLEPRCEILILTHGQFSLIHALIALLAQTGPADVAMSTWTAAHADASIAAQMIQDKRIRSMKLVVDRSFETRQPEYCAVVRSLFGDGAIRTTRSHAKWATVRNDRWNLAIRTSMNLNTNPRLETLEISDDARLADFLDEIVRDLFDNQQPGLFSGELPSLATKYGDTGKVSL